MAGWHHANADWKPKPCATCGATFTPRSGAHRFCSDACRGKWKYVTGAGGTEEQYKKISGDWRRYFNRLLQLQKRKEAGLTVDFLLALLASQTSRCALTGVELTCLLERGKRTESNASIDRIDNAAGYEPSNVRLVCWRANLMRSNQTDEQLRHWRRAILEGGSSDKA